MNRGRATSGVRTTWTYVPGEPNVQIKKARVHTSRDHIIVCYWDNGLRASPR
jgi:hypothetical protein